MKWKYTVCRETPEVLGSGSSYDMIVTTYDENKAFELLKKDRNHLERIGKTDGKIIEQYYDIWNSKWVESETMTDDLLSRKAVLDTLDKMDKALDEDRTIENYKALLKECYEILPPVKEYIKNN